MIPRVTYCEARKAITAIERQLDLATPPDTPADVRLHVDAAREQLRRSISQLDQALRLPVSGTIHFGSDR